MRTPHNQYNSMVRPLQKWLEEHGVRFELRTRVTDLCFVERSGKKAVERILYESGRGAGVIVVNSDDIVIVTLGSMTEASCLGSMDKAPVLAGPEEGGAWALWKKIAAGRPEFGHPSVFSDHIDEIQMDIIHRHFARANLLFVDP